ncbi:peptidase T [Paenibacillus glufosinatiresistens]|uniref:peptidase T n=1 Tax=Paenibacillus glufosinatiresistens TaxID=3070657 RepID=UPI00286DA91B|nr:peptidase T [Paenibacillus sp. YX.27]
MKQELIERLVRYAQVDTQSSEDSSSCPTTPGQLELGRLLAGELQEIGLEDIAIDEGGYVTATLPANTDKDVPVIGFLAHLDTSPDFSGRNVSPQVVENYDGGDLPLGNSGIVMTTDSFPELAGYKGHTLITTDGTTLLGADNKAGIAEIMTAMHHLKAHPEIPHGTIRVAFTPDEEIGRGPHRFNVPAFGAAYAYTVDGGPLGELEYESFNAAVARITVRGVIVHPGTAKGKMIHAAKIAMAFHQRIPAGEAPEFTEGYEGFYHLNSMEGGADVCTLKYYIRDFDRQRFEERKAFLAELADEFRSTYGAERIELEMRDQYYNMREKIEPVRFIVDTAEEAMRGLGIVPVIKPIRGGTDGSQLSYMGLPTPNLFTGGENFHGKFEYASVNVMEAAARVIVEIARLFEAKA